MVTNPFSVKSPEGLQPKEIASLFVDVFTDFPKLKDIGHTFLHGARGTGKSMMLRALEPRVQIAVGRSASVDKLPFFAIHAPIKKANLAIPELGRMDETAFSILGEHLLCTHVASRIFESLLLVFPNLQESASEVSSIVVEKFCSLLQAAGANVTEHRRNKLASAPNPFEAMRDAMDDEFRIAHQFLKRYSFAAVRDPYQGSLIGYLDFLFPIASSLQSLSFMPNAPLFLMLDDADNLAPGLQKILNSWVATRTQDVISLKISTQLTYRTWRTTDGTVISSPHDFTEIDIGTIYSSKTDRYYDRVREIAKKRIALLHPEKGIDPTTFFPQNEEQRIKIEALKERRKELHDQGLGRGYRRSDDSTRYAVPDYMVSLAGTRKASNTFSYAGFSSLVYLSSGIVRWFLDAAAQMFSETLSEAGGDAADITHISPRIQDRVIAEWSESFLEMELTKFQASERTDDQSRDIGSIGTPGERLGVLVNSLGEVFRSRLLDESASERKLFSIVVTGEISQEVKDVLDRGVQWGYLQKSTIGSKSGVGRVPQYILSRRLAPYYKLDPSGYAGYLTVTAEMLERACFDTRKFVNERVSKRSSDERQTELPLGE